MCQVSVHSFVKFAVTAVFQTWSLPNQAKSSVSKSVIERVLLLTVFFFADDNYLIHLFPLKVAEFMTFKDFLAVKVGTPGAKS